MAEGGAAEKIDVAGETPNLAARLQSLAGANEMVIAPSTHALVGGLFDGSEIGRVELKGLPDPVSAWRVTGERAVVSRYDALRSARGSNDLIGRESELARISDRLADARAGAGQVVLVVSQPGFGKSRLVEEVHRIAGADERGRLVLQCSPDQGQTPFFPVISPARVRRRHRHRGFARRPARQAGGVAEAQRRLFAGAFRHRARPAARRHRGRA